MAYSVPNPVEFKNSVGQTINPGDSVVIVTTSTRSVGTYIGKYLGMHKNGGVQCEKQVQTSFYVFKDTGERVPYSYFNKMNSALNKFAQEYRLKNPQANYWTYYSDPGYTAIRDEYYDRIELKTEFVTRRTTLQRNRIFKAA